MNLRSVEPAWQVLGDERVVGEVGMLAADAVDRFALPEAQPFTWIEAPRAFEQTLPAQHLVAAGDAAVEVVRDVEEGAVAVGDAAVEREQLAIDGPRRAGVDADLLALDSRVTDCNSAFFDVAHAFHGCIAGCHEVLRRQGLLEGTWCLDPGEGLSPGQREAIDRVCREHADLGDDAFVAEHLQRWLD